MVCVLDTLCSSITMALNRERVSRSLVDELSMCDVGSVAWVERNDLLWTQNLSYWHVCLSDRRIEGLLKVFG